MSAFITVILLALMGTAYAQSSTGFITQRAAERQRYETELEVSCNTGDDRACFELFFSLNRMYLAIAGGILVALILVSFCVCCCCCYKKKSRKRSAKRFQRPEFDSVIIAPSSQSLLSHKAP